MPVSLMPLIYLSGSLYLIFLPLLIWKGNKSDSSSDTILRPTVAPFAFGGHLVIWEEPRQTPTVPRDLGLTSYHIWILLKLVGNHEILSLQSSGVNWNQRGITHSIVPLITAGSCLPPAASHPHCRGGQLPPAPVTQQDGWERELQCLSHWRP